MSPQVAPEQPTDVRHLVEQLPLPTPREIFDGLGQRGYVGQDYGRRALSLLAHRHLRRLRYLHLDRIPRAELPPKENHLLIGPTGSGKTFAVELLFREALGLPTCIIDVTTLSETGYVGGDVSSVLTRLLYAAGMDPVRAEIGVVCLDEFDKLSGGANQAVFSGAGTTKDVTGRGVQRELLKLLEASKVPVSTGMDHSTYHPTVLVDTADIAFVAAGAFSGLKTVTRSRRDAAGMGFTQEARRREKIAVRYQDEELADVGAFQAYGFLPELMGRFSRIVPFDPLGEPELRQILEGQVVPNRRREMELADIDLEIDDTVFDNLIKRALRRETGARGLGSALALVLEEAAFEAYSAFGPRKVVLRVRDGHIVSQVERLGPDTGPITAEIVIGRKR
jgi:ATP-dependent Clp protease ATP-binding subunit ClpX